MLTKKKKKKGRILESHRISKFILTKNNNSIKRQKRILTNSTLLRPPTVSKNNNKRHSYTRSLDPHDEADPRDPSAHNRGAPDRSNGAARSYELGERVSPHFLEGWKTRNCDRPRWRRARSNVIRSRSRSSRTVTRNETVHRLGRDSRLRSLARSSHASHRYYNIRPVVGYFQPTVKIYPPARVQETYSMKRADHPLGERWEIGKIGD